MMNLLVAENRISNLKLQEIKTEFMSLNWSGVAQEAGLNVNFMHDILENRKRCTLKSAEKLFPVLKKYGVQINTPSELVGTN